MKVMFLFQGLPHYYNYVLNRLNRVPGLQVLNVIPRQTDRLPDGVYQTREDIEFRVCELDEYSFGGGTFFRGFWRLLITERPDVLVVTDAHLRGLYRAPATRAVLRLLGVPVILKTIPFRMETYDEARRRTSQYFRDNLTASPIRLLRLALSTLRRLWRLHAYRRQCRLPAAHVNYVEAAYDIFGSYGVEPERIFITYNSPDTDRLLEVRRRLLSEGVDKFVCAHRLIHVGRLARWKRVDLLLRAVARLRPSFPDLELLVIGSGPMANDWKQLAAELDLGASVRFLGGVYDPEELGRYLMTSAVYVLAGMGGLSINEAMCFGRPIVCSVCDGTERHLVQDGYNGYVFQDADLDDLCRCLTDLLRDPARTAEMGRNSLEIIAGRVNIHTVIAGYVRALNYVTGQSLEVAQPATEGP